MRLVTRQPGAVTEISFFVITEKIFIEQIAADSSNQFTAEQQTGAFGAENRIAVIIFSRVLLVVTIMIQEAKVCQEGATSIQRTVMSAQNHLALHDAHLRLGAQIFNQRLKEIRGNDGVAVEQKYELSIACGEAEIISARKSAIPVAVQDPDAWILRQHFFRSVDGGIVHHNHLKTGIVGPLQRCETVAQNLRTIIVHNQDGNQRPVPRGKTFLRC